MDDKQYQRLVERHEATIELEQAQQAEKAERDRRQQAEWERQKKYVNPDATHDYDR